MTPLTCARQGQDYAPLAPAIQTRYAAIAVSLIHKAPYHCLFSYAESLSSPHLVPFGIKDIDDLDESPSLNTFTVYL